MCPVVPSIYKAALGKNSHFVLKYSDLETCFLGRAEKNVYLSFWFCAGQAFWKNERDRLRLEGEYKLAWLHYRPTLLDIDRLLSHPWDKERKPIVVKCHVYALSNEVAAKTKITRKVLREVLRKEIDKIATGDIFERCWQVTAWLHAREHMLECVSTVGKGVKLLTASKQLIDLDQNAGASAPNAVHPNQDRS